MKARNAQGDSSELAPTEVTSASDGMPVSPQAVHEVIMRIVRPGREQEFEMLVEQFFRQATQQPGVLGAYLIRPFSDSQSRHYGILRSFKTAKDRDQFYRSALYKQWNDAIAPIVEGEPQRSHLHGLEAFFRVPGAPPRWKMALLTWVGVTPAVYVFSHAVPMVFGNLSMLVRLLVVNAFVVASLAWILMPILTKLFRVWLRPAH